MFKKRFFSPKHDFKTGILCKISFIFGAIFLVLYIFLKIVSAILDESTEGVINQLYEFSISQTTDTFAAFGIILIAVGVILYFFQCQFAKLAEIADDIENNEEYLESK